jgi:uncharacterized RDD family membrane protein YckC
MTEPSLSGPRADTGKRFLAYLIDAVILIIPIIIISAAAPDLARLVGLLVGLAYFVYFDGSPSGQTVGKRAMGIRVVDFQTGGPLDYGKAFIRYLGRIVASLVCLLGYFWAIWDPQHQGWHDKIAGTVVVPVDSYPVSSWP